MDKKIKEMHHNHIERIFFGLSDNLKKIIGEELLSKTDENIHYLNGKSRQIYIIITGSSLSAGDYHWSLS